MPSRQPRWPSIGLNSCSASIFAAHRGGVGAERRRDLADLLVAVGQELVERRVEQPDRDRQPVHRAEDPDEVAALHRQELRERALARPPASPARIISRTARMRSGSKNMCSVRQRPMPSAPNWRAILASCRRVGVGAHAQRAAAGRPSSSARAKVPPSSGVTVGHRAEHHLAGRAVEGDRVARAHHVAVDAHLAAPRSRCAASPQPATQHLPMPRATTAAWEVMPPRAVRMPCGGVHAVDVLGRGLDAHQDRPSRPPWRAPRPRRRVNTTFADGGAGRGRQPLGDHRARGARGRASGAAAGRAEPGSTRRTASSREISLSFAMSTAIFTAARAVRLPVRVCSIQSLPLLDGELDVLHVAVVLLEPLVDAHQLAVGRGHLLLERRQARPGRARGSRG